MNGKRGGSDLRVGEKISVIGYAFDHMGRTQRRVYAVTVRWAWETVQYEPCTYDVHNARVNTVRARDEGLTWCRGCDGDTADAFQAACALLNPQQQPS